MKYAFNAIYVLEMASEMAKTSIKIAIIATNYWHDLFKKS